MNQYLRQLRYYAEHNPKASSAALIAGTAASCVVMVAFIELRDRYNYQKHKNSSTRSGPEDDVSPQITKGAAQLAAMRETARNSTWQQNLQNAADAQARFVLPGQSPGDTPEYVRRIDERSEEMLQTERERQEKERESKDDPSRSRFWK